MRLHIERSSDGKNILCVKDFEDIHDRGEIAHFIAELTSALSELNFIWNTFNDNKESD